MPTDSELMSKGMQKAADVLRTRSRPQSSLPLMKFAFARAPDVGIARAGYWAGLHFGDSNFSRACLDFLEARAFGAQARWLEGKRARLSDLPPSPEDLEKWAVRTPCADAFSPLADRLCYFLHASLPHVSTGYATRSQGMAAGLRASGLDVICITRPGFPKDMARFDPAQDVPPETRIDGVPYMHVPEPARTGLSGPDYVFQAGDRLTDLLAQLRPERVMAASNYVTAAPALIAARRLGIPFHYEIRGFWEISRAAREPDFARTEDYARLVTLESAIARSADHVFTLSQPMKEEAVARGVDPDKVTLAPNSCDPSRFEPRPRDPELAARYDIPASVPVIGYVGSFTPYEGLEDLTRACIRLSAQGHDFRLLLVGNDAALNQDTGPIGRRLWQIANDEGLAGKLIMPGRVPHDTVEAHYSLIDIAPFPRLPERITEMVPPIKPLEALAMEKAVIVSSVRALAEMIDHGRTGLVFEKGDVEALTRGLARLLAEPDTRRRLGRAGRAWVMAERSWNRTARVLADAMARSGG